MSASSRNFEVPADALPEAIALVRPDGSITALNAAARRLFGLEPAAEPPPLGSLLEDAGEKVAEYLGLCVRSAQAVPGSFFLRRRDDSPALRVASEGMRCGGPEDRAVLLRLRPARLAVRRFVALREKIDALNREVAERRRAESILTAHNQVLELIARPAPLGEILDALDSIVRDHPISADRLSARDVALLDLVNRTGRLAREKEALERERERHRVELAARNAELERFAFAASHDLQQPLRQVSSYVQLLARRYKGRLDSEADEFIHFAVEGAARMSDLINGVLDFTRIGHPRPGNADASEALSRALANLAQCISETGASVTSATLPTLSADVRLLERVFQNLVSNALKFRREEPPKVRIECRREARFWTFSVADNGIGIEEGQREKLFDLFRRLHPEYPGTGIGLAVTRRIVEAHGGRIWVESNPGAGSTFFFTIPG